MDEQRKALIDTFKRRAKEIEREIMIDNVDYISKSATISIKYRNAGNTLYKKKDHDSNEHEEIFRNYCHSISFAPPKSKELMLAYGNRSAFLLHIKKYNECIKDIDRALDMSALISFNIKLLCRKSECFIGLESLSKSKSTLNEAKILLKNLEDEKSKKTLQALISKVETTCNNTKQKNPNEIKESEDIVLSETSDIYNSVSVKYTEKYGRGLVALRNYEPGEIIFVEKLYATVPHLQYSYKYCHHCLVYSWAGIPCENCHMALFCSEQCKNEAMKAYHDIECAVIPEVVKNGLSAEKFYFSIRLLIMGLKEVASFEKLKSILQFIDQKSDKSSLGQQKNEKYNQDFSSIYDLQSASKYSPTDELAYQAISCLIFIAKRSNIFGDIILKGFKHFSENEDILFIGSLLIKLLEITEVNSHNVIDMLRSKCTDKVICNGNRCCRRGSCISPLASLINHNCFPNTSRCFTEDRKIIIFALHPIKKDEMLFDCYCSPFYTQNKNHRHADLRWSNIICDCQACVENWPLSILRTEDPLSNRDFVRMFPRTREELKLLQDNENIVVSCGREDFKCDAKVITKLSKSITRAFETCPSPSVTTCYLVHAMRRAFVSIYGLKEQRTFHQSCN